MIGGRWTASLDTGDPFQWLQTYQESQQSQNPLNLTIKNSLDDCNSSRTQVPKSNLF